MTKYSVASQRRAAPRPEPVHAVWRGIGCLLILIVPVLSYLLAAATVKFAVSTDWPMPYQLMGYPLMPAYLRSVSGLAPVLDFIEKQRNLYAILLVAVVYIVAIGAFISLGYAVMYRFIGPPRYGPLDAPPPSVKVKRYKR